MKKARRYKNMEITFISIHELSTDARTRYVSDAVEDILGYQPHEIVSKPIWQFFHQDELAQARTIYNRVVHHDKAAGLNYFRIKHKNGDWIGCECVFTVVYDVLVASTSIYHSDARSQKRAVDAPVVRRLFASSTRDPRYHMLSYMSTKFSQVPNSPVHEPRAALFINRFTRTATIMYATPSVSNVLGISAAELTSTSFYYCIEECCLPQAVECLESAKANDSIAYLRFWFRYPPTVNSEDRPLSSSPDLGSPSSSFSSSSSSSSSSQISTAFPPRPSRIEVEAVVSCSSDGLVVIVRRARPLIPGSVQAPGHPVYANGLFASPWAAEPILPPPPSEQTEIVDLTGDSVPRNGPEPEDLMDTIRDVAVLAWAVVGTNGTLKKYSTGTPVGESQPPQSS